VISADEIGVLPGNLYPDKKSSSYVLPSFMREVTVQRFIQYLVNVKTFSLDLVKRQMHAYLSVERRRVGSRFKQIRKADGRLVRDMFDSKLFRCGVEKLPVDSHSLRVDAMILFHRNVCNLCRATEEGQVSKACYFATMIACLDNGWNPMIDEVNVVRKFKAPRSINYAAVDQFNGSTAKEFEDMRVHGVVVPCFLDPRGVVNSLGSVVKGADKIRALILARIKVVGQATLTAASDVLVSIGQPKIKARIITDATATGINAAAYSPVFSYPGLSDCIQLVYHNCCGSITLSICPWCRHLKPCH
jgi:hypothetical protein